LSSATKILLYAAVAILAFAAGGFYWKLSKRFTTPDSFYKLSSKESPQRQLPASGILVIVGGEELTVADVEWEFQLHTSGIHSTDNLTQIPEMGTRYAKELEPLKQMLFSSLIERKIVYSYIARETDFDLSDPNVFVPCLKKWQDTIASSSTLELNTKGQERLKQRLCEQNIIQQFLKTKIFNQVVVKDEDIASYYKEKRQQFRRPARITIRQIVTATEKKAKKLLRRVKRYNFEKLAREHSIAPEAQNGGLLGPFGRGDMPPVFDVAFGMKVGQIRGGLKSTYGFHIFLLLKKIKKEDLSLTEAQDEIRAFLSKSKKERKYQELIESALNAVEVRPSRSYW
jgi:hypothetical protein